MTERDTIHEYLKTLSKYLGRLEKENADEVIREIESHIYDALEAGEAQDTVTLASILEGFGNPRDLASQYVDHILGGTPPPQGFRAIQHVKTGVTWSLVVATAVFGYGFAATLLCLGVYKLVFPGELGLWATNHGNSWIITNADTAPQGGTNEVLGWWFVPCALGLGIIVGYLTKRLVTALRRQI